MTDLRAVFAKTGRAVYISHLDLNRCMQRAFKRSRLPIWYTEGFNPHAYIMFALALSLGFESQCEIMDFTLTEDVSCEEVRSRLNAVMPEGIEILSVGKPVKKHTEIAFSEFETNIFSENPALMETEFKKFISQEKITVLKRNKKKQMIETDIKPFVQILEISHDDEKLTVMLRLPAGTQKNYNPSLITEAFVGFSSLNAEYVFTRRIKIICADGKDFC